MQSKSPAVSLPESSIIKSRDRYEVSGSEFLVVAKINTNDATADQRLVKNRMCRLLVYCFAKNSYLPGINVELDCLPSESLAMDTVTVHNFQVDSTGKITDKKVLLHLEILLLQAMRNMYHPQVQIVGSGNWFIYRFGIPPGSASIVAFRANHELPMSNVGGSLIRKGKINRYLKTPIVVSILSHQFNSLFSIRMQ